MHWEQPAKSLMFLQPGISEIHTFTRAAQFDMCNVGDLRDPQNHLHMRKSMTIVTTSPSLYRALHGRNCQGHHVHQPIEGRTMVDHQSMNRSQYTEVYPRKFARLVAIVLDKSCRELPFHWQPGLIALSQCEVTEPTLVAHKVIGHPSRKYQFTRSELVYPESRSEQLAKRRRMVGKQNPEICLEDCQEILSRIDRVAPRVGRKEITDETIVQPLQRMCHDKKIVSVMVCRGMDRTMAPPSHIHAQEAPYRKTLMILRPSGQVAIEKEWEDWSNLSHRQLVRPAHACKIHVAIFAVNHQSITTESASSSSNSRVDQGVGATPEIQSQHHDGMTPSTGEDLSALRPMFQTTPETSDVGPLPEQSERFSSLPKWEQNQIKLMHRNLGHPSNERLSKALQLSGYRAEVVNAANDLRCGVCAKHSPPKHQRPGSLKTLIDFNDKIYLDAISWTGQNGKTFNFYHILDASSHYHVAFGSPSRLSVDVISGIQQNWISWAGAPRHLVVDAATELNSEEFMQFSQRFNIQCTTICPEAHWQNGKIERHGQFLQEMLSKVDAEHPVTSYQELQHALNQCTQSKNMLSIRHGYSPQVIVFGKQSRLPGSVLSDESIPSHLSVIQELDESIQDGFRKQLQLRETARRAFHVADNSDALRRAALRRSCPDRGTYQAGQWVMIYRTQHATKPGWIGPQRVIIQDDSHTVWTTQGGKLYRSAPEHVRRSLPEEGTPEGPELPTDLTSMQQQIHRLNQLPPIPEEQLPSIELPPEHQLEVPVPTPEEPRDRVGSQGESIAQPDHEPEIMSHQSSSISESSPRVEGEIVQLLCVDDEACAFTTCDSHEYAFRCEFEVSVRKDQKNPSEESIDPWILLTTGAAKQRSEVRLTELTREERKEFDQAKQKGG